MRIFYKVYNDHESCNNQQVELVFDSRIVISEFLENINIQLYKIDKILVNKKYKNLDYVLKDNDIVEIFLFKPVEINIDLKFVCDVHLGKLVRYLRMLGFDTIIAKNKHILIDILVSQKRIFLTKDIKTAILLKIKNCIIFSSNPLEQLKEVVYKLQLNKFSRPFTRCLVCNDLLENIEKEKVIDHLPPKVKDFHDEFFICNGCKKIYWKGTHYERMLSFIDLLKDIS